MKVLAVARSRYFLDHDNVMGDPVYETMMKNLFIESNATGGLNRHCIAAMAPDEHWKCNFASGAYSYTQAPIFALNSALDAWQTGCIYTATLDPGFPKTTPPVTHQRVLKATPTHHRSRPAVCLLFCTGAR